MTGLWLLAGAAVGILNSLTRWWTVARLHADMESNALLLTLGGLSLRLALVSILLIAGLSDGATSGLLAFAGLWLVRSAGVIWIHSGRVTWPAVPASADHE